MKKAVFLDRDGTINVDYGYVSKVEKFVILPGAIEGLKKMRSMNYLLIIISNQSGIGRGYYSIPDYEKVMEAMHNQLNLHGITLDDCFYCPHSPESNCSCRKPGTKMIEEAVRKWDVNVKESFFIGDKESDIKAGEKSGLKTILVSENEKEFGQDFRVKNLVEAAGIIEKENKTSEDRQ